MRFLALLSLVTLCACGADGPPVAPSAPVGLSVTGTAKVGVASG